MIEAVKQSDQTQSHRDHHSEPCHYSSLYRQFCIDTLLTTRLEFTEALIGAVTWRIMVTASCPSKSVIRAKTRLGSCETPLTCGSPQTGSLRRNHYQALRKRVTEPKVRRWQATREPCCSSNNGPLPWVPATKDDEVYC